MLPKRKKRDDTGTTKTCAEARKLFSQSYVVIGGGIAGVSCAQELARLIPHGSVTLISATEVLKEVRYEHMLLFSPQVTCDLLSGSLLGQ